MRRTFPTALRALACAGWLGIHLAVSIAPAAAAECRRSDLPDPACTPGQVRPDLTVAQICKTKWGKDARAVTAAMKRRVFEAYGLSGNKDPYCRPAGCEIDHLLSRELGGADDERNLWPERYAGTWNARAKDRLENRLHKELCTGGISLKDARGALTGDWRKAFRERFGTPE